MNEKSYETNSVAAPGDDLSQKMSNFIGQVTELIKIAKKDDIQSQDERDSLRVAVAKKHHMATNPIITKPGLTKSSSANLLIKTPKDDRVACFSVISSNESSGEDGTGAITQMLKDKIVVAQDKEELMRRRDLKSQFKSEQSIASSSHTLTTPQVEHKCRRGERYWSDEEHERFLEAIRLFGKNWCEITRHVGTRNRQSVYSHAQKFRKRV